MSSKKGAKRSRRISGDAPEAQGEAGEADGGPASAAASASSSASPHSLVLATAAVGKAGGAGGAIAVVLATAAADMGRIFEEQLRAVRSDHAQELAAVRSDLAAVHRDLAAVRGELGDARYEMSRRFVLLDSRGATTEIGLVCRRGIPDGLDEYNEYRSVLSVLFGFQEFSDLGDGLMRFFTTKEARELRLVHSEFLDAVTATPWNDMETQITGRVADELPIRTSSECRAAI